MRLAGLAILTMLSISGFARLVSANLALPGSDASNVSADAEVLLCPPSEEIDMLLAAIAERQDDLEGRDAEVRRREEDIEIARREIALALDDLAAAETRLEARMAMSARAAEDDVGRLVTVYEGMKPKDAARLFEAMEPPFAAGFLARMRPEAAAAIFSNLPPGPAYALSVEMAGRNANAATE
jgi:flagellar motility protein MotE (MotC chaperone)